MESTLKEVTKEEWEQLRKEIISAAHKARKYIEDMNWYYAKQQVEDSRIKSGLYGHNTNFTYPKGYSNWTIRHFSQVGCCSSAEKFLTAPVTCLLRSPDGKHYTAQHLPGFCPIHDLIGRKEK